VVVALGSVVEVISVVADQQIAAPGWEFVVVVVDLAAELVVAVAPFGQLHLQGDLCSPAVRADKP